LIVDPEENAPIPVFVELLRFTGSTDLAGRGCGPRLPVETRGTVPFIE
jgi:hypothetical protein